MEMESINIVELIENNPITKLSNDYNVKLLTKIKENFTNFEQQIFLSSFYCYLNYDQKNDFVIDLDDVWKWLGFSVKIKAKVLLEKYFVEEKDYKKSLYDSAQQSTHTKGGQNKFETSSESILKILETSVKLEELLIDKSKDIDTLLDFLSNNKIINNEEETDPEVPIVRKSKRSIDQINKDSGEVIKTYESIEAAGRSLGLTTGTAIGIALRENRVCKRFLWRYSGVSKEEQFTEQPVIKVCCLNGEKTYFKNISDAAKDAKVSHPALRNRVLTDVHTNNYHWVFNKEVCH